MAARTGDLETVKVLLNNNADPFVKTLSGKSTYAVPKSHQVAKAIERTILQRFVVKFMNEMQSKEVTEYYKNRAADI